MKIAAGSHTLAGILFWIIFAADLLICGDLSTVTDAAMLKTMFIVQMNRSAHCLRIASLFMTANFILRYHLIVRSGDDIPLAGSCAEYRLTHDWRD